MAKMKKLSAKEIAVKVDEFGQADADAKAYGLTKTRLGNELKEMTEAGTTLFGDRYKAVVDERANREADPEKTIKTLFDGDWSKAIKAGVVKISLSELAKKFGSEQIDRVCVIGEPTKTITAKPL